jgi:hypothetical protein
MRTVHLPLALIALLLLLAACSKNEPIGTIDPGNNPSDTTKKNPLDTLGPCQTALNPAVVKNGFTLNGDGFVNQVINIDPNKTDIDQEVSDGSDSTATLQLSGPAYVSGTDSARVTMALLIPDVTGAVAGTKYPWTPSDLAKPTGITIRYTRGGVTRVFQPALGSTTVKTSKFSFYPYEGTFCGYLKDSATSVRVAINGHYLVD